VDISFHSSIASIGKSVWDALNTTDYPFTRFEFLSALENTHDKNTNNSTHNTEQNAACSDETGWQPYHLLISHDYQPQAVMPLYLKYHSYGEYIFDWAWADAYQQHGIPYYPKLLAAIPFTPCTGPRLLCKDQTQLNAFLDIALKAIKNQQDKLKLSSAHLLFNSEAEAKLGASANWKIRETVQYHWFNRNHLNPQLKPYSSFDDLLSTFKSRKRKTVRKEREQIAKQAIIIKRLNGSDISTALWDQFYRFYQTTYAKRSGHLGYLPKHFFHQIANTMPDQIMMSVAFDKNSPSTPIAAALFFHGNHTLFGRYWGCNQETEHLHFELCYYQGIEFCIEHQIQHFDAGAQGEHKIQRGFIPIKTYSNHLVRHPDFNRAIANFIHHESKQHQAYIEETFKTLPYNDEFLTNILSAS